MTDNSWKIVHITIANRTDDLYEQYTAN